MKSLSKLENCDRRAMNWYLSIICAISGITASVVAITVAASSLRYVVVVGDSMSPSFSDGESFRCVTISEEKLCKERAYPVCVIDTGENETVIKRLIGYPGDTVRLVDGDTYVNDELIMRRTTESWDNATYKVPPNSYLFLGDNRASSLDARFWNDTYLDFNSIRYVIVNSNLVASP